ncbi:response regulator transcription factor [Chitinimonas sp. BJB300]|uniref:response regulator transcription factor n=1 Tax=Chitinimonas sp. BJB300 TaxID=1559339 RepID=UPI000C0D40D5|nr:response regulator transcription factor [Chitinimonas sp. BJB300]PHV11223.1 DNA-binding response regulator [Chitinimonas sp. BJB300]TSJ87382.1 response regulator transcription factor [Chitinimonas sp. BJB300]
MRILLVEDDNLLGDGLRVGLTQAGFTVDWVKDGIAADAAMAANDFAAVVLDWNLPRQDGLALLKKLRSRRDATPVLMLTARDALADRIAGLDAGADDFLIKPVAIAELAARLRALTRRAAGRSEPLFRHAGLTLDPARRCVEMAGKQLELSVREFDLLALLIAQPGRPLSREQIENALYGWGEEVESNAIEVHVHHLRKKLGADWIKTLRGVGYVLKPENTA